MKLNSALETLKQAALAGKLAHALLFIGESLPARLEASKELARIVLCDAPVRDGACGECPQCHLMERSSHPDYRVVSPEEDAKNIKIEQVRALISEGGFKPFQAKAKVMVVDRAELMSEAGQNAFLKTLEEPPGRAHFILIPQDLNGLLPTIRSRAQAYYFAAPPTAEVALDDPEFKALRDGLFARLCEPRTPGAEWPELGRMEKKELGILLDSLIEDFRELLVLRAGAKQLVTSTGSLAHKEALTKVWSSERISERIEALADAKEKIVSQSLNAKLVMANLCLNTI